MTTTTVIGRRHMLKGLRWSIMEQLGVKSTAELLQHIESGAHPEVKRVAQDYLGAHFLQGTRGDALHRAGGAHGAHRGRREHDRDDVDRFADNFARFAQSVARHARVVAH